MAHTISVEFIETQIFSSELRRLLPDEPYRHLQLILLLRPEQGAIIKGSGGLRKIRWGSQTRGKRGGFRVIYYWDKSVEVIYMLLIYDKTDQDDLTPQQLKILKKTVEKELKR